MKIRALILFALFFMISGCGQSGKLYLPEKNYLTAH